MQDWTAATHFHFIRQTAERELLQRKAKDNQMSQAQDKPAGIIYRARQSTDL